jgi:ubiquinone/menaquinone biosynthesis C-methylase UbiE
MDAVKTMPIREANELEPTHHPVRARLNAWLLAALDRYMDVRYREVKRELFGGLPHTVVELGAGDGANFRHLRRGTHVIAIEPNVHMHTRLRAAARRDDVTVDVRTAIAERLPLPDASVDAVISSLVLCSVADPARALAEIRRVLRPGGRYWCVEHVAAPEGSTVRRLQRAVHRPWRWLFEGCETQRDTAQLLREAGFTDVEVTPFTVRTAFVPIRPHIAAVALK